MFTRLAKFLGLGPRHWVPNWLEAMHSNDNLRGRRRPTGQCRSPQPALACHWILVEDGRLECHWELESFDETSAEEPGGHQVRCSQASSFSAKSIGLRGTGFGSRYATLLDRNFRRGLSRGAMTARHRATAEREWTMTVTNEQAVSGMPNTAQRYGVDTVLDRTLRDPIIRSAVGIVRESACLLYHVAGLGIALMSGPETSRRQCGNKQTRSAAPNGVNVIQFPNSKRRAIGQDSTEVDHDCLE